MSKIPLYNCYWCRCGWCVRRSECLDHCIFCLTQKKFKMSDYCDKFLEDNLKNRKLYAEIRKCDNCDWKRFFNNVKDLLEESPI